MGGWGLENPYSVGILNPLEIIGRSLTEDQFGHRIPQTNLQHSHEAYNVFLLFSAGI